MPFKKLVLVLFAMSILFFSCTNDVPNNEVALGAYDKGVLVLSQGGFGRGDASVSYVSSDFMTFQNDIFSLTNPSMNLGDTGQDIGLNGDFAYIVLNVSNKIEVVNRYTMLHVATINGLNNPRYIAFSNGKGFVTNWGDGSNPADDFVAVINLSSNTIIRSIPVAEGPERIVENAGKLYAAHYGGFGFGNSISVIDAASSTFQATIAVGDLPNDMQIKEGFLWVSCSGMPSYASAETAGKLVKINLTTNQVVNTIGYSDVTKHLANLVIEGSNAYYTVDADVFKMPLTASTLPVSPVFSASTQGVSSIYSFAIKDNHIYVGDAGNYSDLGKVYVYSQGGNTGLNIGTLEKTLTVGVIPAGFYFN